MADFRRERLTLNQMMEILGAEFTKEPFIKYDPTIEPQYHIIRQQAHDGTSIFVVDMMMEAMLNLFSRNSYYKPMGPPPEDHDVVYTVGEIKRAVVYGMVDVKAGRIRGQRERLKIPVRCEYVKSTT